MESGVPSRVSRSYYIDLPIDEIKAYLYDFSKLYQKIGDAVNLLNQLQT